MKTIVSVRSIVCALLFCACCFFSSTTGLQAQNRIGEKFESADSTMKFCILTENTVGVGLGSVSPSGHLIIPGRVTYKDHDYTVTQIGYLMENNSLNNFRFISGVDSVTIPNTVTRLLGQAFCRINSLEYVKLSDSCTYIGFAAFGLCTGLGAVEFGPKLDTIEQEAFYNCTGFDTLRLPASMEYIGKQAFSGCAFYHIEVDENNKHFSSKDGVLYNKNYSSLLRYPPMATATAFSVPATVTEIGETSFVDAIYLKTISLPEGVKKIGLAAFLTSGITGLTLPNSLETIEYNAFNGCLNLKTVAFGNSLKHLGSGAFYRCPITAIDLPAGLERIDHSAFELTAIEGSVDIPASVAFMGEGVFEGVTGLTAVNVQSANKRYSSFDGVVYNKAQDTLFFCPRGKNARVKLADNLCHIGYNAFGYSNVTGIEMPNTVRSIDTFAFQRCRNLLAINFSTNLKTIGFSTFSNCHSLKKIEFPEGLETIGSFAFEHCKTVQEIVCPNSLQSLGQNAFYGNIALKTFTFPESLPVIPVMVLHTATSLETIVFPKDVQRIESQAFSNCSMLESLAIPEGVTFIDERALANMKSLKDLILPSTIETIGANQFFGNKEMRTLEVRNSVPPTLGDTPFELCPEDLVVYVPCGSSDAYLSRSAWQNVQLEESAFNHVYVEVNNAEWGSARVQMRPTCENPRAIVEAFPNMGYIFEKWSDGSTQNPYEFEVNSDTTVTAIFKQVTAVEELEGMEKLSVYVKEGVIYIDYADPQAEVTVISANGCQVYRGVGRKIKVKTPALYLVRIGTAVEKIMTL